jgi:uncharacterized integral membrane protein
MLEGRGQLASYLAMGQILPAIGVLLITFIEGNISLPEAQFTKLISSKKKNSKTRDKISAT